MPPLWALVHPFAFVSREPHRAAKVAPEQLFHSIARNVAMWLVRPIRGKHRN